MASFCFVPLVIFILCVSYIVPFVYSITYTIFFVPLVPFILRVSYIPPFLYSITLTIFFVPLVPFILCVSYIPPFLYSTASNTFVPNLPLHFCVTLIWPRISSIILCLEPYIFHVQIPQGILLCYIVFVIMIFLLYDMYCSNDKLNQLLWYNKVLLNQLLWYNKVLL